MSSSMYCHLPAHEAFSIQWFFEFGEGEGEVLKARYSRGGRKLVVCKVCYMHIYDPLFCPGWRGELVS